MRAKKIINLSLAVSLALTGVISGSTAVMAEESAIDESKEYSFVFAEHVANVEEQAPQVYAMVQ